MSTETNGSGATITFPEPPPDQHVEALQTIHDTQVAVAQTAARVLGKGLRPQRMSVKQLRRMLERKLKAAGVRSAAGLANRR